jgi:enoyl-[acyl-carrier protein] reductase/trans-2-enoyl-CoA reductase (NAD+)
LIIKPRIRGFVCTTAHPAGCEAGVREQIEYVAKKGSILTRPLKALIVGASTGYGLASRITAAFGCGSSTVGVFLEREPTEKRPATAGWYNSVAFEKAARVGGLFAKSINGDAFSPEVKSRVIDVLKNGPGPVDLLVYSLAAPLRRDPQTGDTARSVLKPLGEPYAGKTLDTDKGIVKEISIEPATEQEKNDTVSVMGGEDWKNWIETLDDEGLLGRGCRTLAFSYVGPGLTRPIYWDGTIGEAKKDLERAARAIGDRLRPRGGAAYVAVMKALVTQASSAIPVVPLYISALNKIMKEKGLYEGCIEQIHRLFVTRLFGGGPDAVDERGRIRMDDWEMRDDVQKAVTELWSRISTENLNDLTDFEGYRKEFLRLFGFGLPGVDYDAEADPLVTFE